MSKDDYKLGKIRATSAIISDVPLGPVKPKRTKLKLIILALILGYIGYAVYSSSASANDNETANSTLMMVIDEMLQERRDRAHYERKKSEVCRKLDQKIADKLIRKIDRPNFSPLESDLNLIEAWEGYCKGRVFDKDLIRKSLQYEHDDKKND